MASKEVVLLANGEMIGPLNSVKWARACLYLMCDDPVRYNEYKNKLMSMSNPDHCAKCGDSFDENRKIHDIFTKDWQNFPRCKFCYDADIMDKRTDAFAEGFDNKVWNDVPINCKSCGELSDKTDNHDICPDCNKMKDNEQRYDRIECAIAEGFDPREWNDVPINCTRCNKLSDETDPVHNICPGCRYRDGTNLSDYGDNDSEPDGYYGYGYYGRDDESEYDPYEDEEPMCNCRCEGCPGDCGTLSCGCIDVCRGRCGRDEYYF